MSVEWCLSGSEGEKGATGPDALVARVAAGQHGVVGTRQLERCGLGANARTVRVRRGHLHPVYRGVYAVGHDALTRTGIFTAAVLACGAHAVLSHHAAAAHLGLVTWDDRDPEITVPCAGGRKIAGISVHRSKLDPRDVWIRDGVLVTCPARTMLDVAASMPAGQLRRTVRQAQAGQHVNQRQLLDVLHRHPRHRGAAKLRAVIALGPAPTRSALEDLVVDLLDRAGIEDPEINAKLHLGGRAMVPDMLWRAHRLIVECDGARWHSDPLTRQDDADRQAILEAHGYRVLRITWWQIVDHPRQTLRRIRAALGDA